LTPVHTLIGGKLANLSGSASWDIPLPMICVLSSAIFLDI